MKLYYPEGMRLHGENACRYLDFEKYNNELDEPCLFWLYFAEDYEYLLAHKGKRYVFWHGSDVMRLQYHKELWQYLRELQHGITHVCHNSLLREELAQIGIHALVRPTFWGDISKYPETYEYSDKPEIYISSTAEREFEYGEGYVIALSKVFADCRFHVYGTDGEETENLIYHGRIPEAVMDEETKDMQIFLRMNRHDGMSQALMKALFRGQYIVSRIKYDHIPFADNFEEIVRIITNYITDDVCAADEPDHGYWRKQINNFDWI